MRALKPSRWSVAKTISRVWENCSDLNLISLFGVLAFFFLFADKTIKLWKMFQKVPKNAAGNGEEGQGSLFRPLCYSRVFSMLLAGLFTVFLPPIPRSFLPNCCSL